jgi:hypothetical protein
MIDVLMLAGAVSTVAKAISSSVKAGKDLTSIIPQVGKLAKLDSEIQLADAGKHKSFIGKLGAPAEEAMAIAQAKAKHKEAMDELRSVCRLYGPSGFWDSFQRELAAARVRHKKELEAKAKVRDQIVATISAIFGILVAISGTSLMLYAVAEFT